MKIAIVGGGAAGLMAASVASEKHRVVLFERQSRVGICFKPENFTAIFHQRGVIKP